MAGTAPALVRPGAPGRTLRVALGIAVLSWLWALGTGWRTLWSGQVPWGNWGFWLLLAFAVYYTPTVFGLRFARQAGHWPLLGVAAALAAAAGASWLTSGSPAGPAFGTALWLWLAAFAALLGVAFLLAAALATPGCEMRSYAHLAARLRGADATQVACPGMADRLDAIGSPDRARGPAR